MTFAGVNYLAIFVAGVAGWMLGAVYYGTLAKPWLAAMGKTMQEVQAQQKAQGAAAYIPYAVAFVAELIMAWVLAGLIGHVGAVTIRSGVISALFVWLGFVATTVGVNNMFGFRKVALSVIDAGHWLAVLVVMGLVIGAFGV